MAGILDQQADAPITPEDVRELRYALGMSQQEFARFLCTSTSCVVSWEAGGSRMHGGLAKLARVTASHFAYRHMMQSLPKPNPRVLALIKRQRR